MTEKRLAEIEGLARTGLPFPPHEQEVYELIAEVRRCWERIKLQRTKISELMDEDETP